MKSPVRAEISLFIKKGRRFLFPSKDEMSGGFVIDTKHLKRKGDKMEYCPICCIELHSITTKTVGTKQICRDCAASLSPLLNAIADGLTARMENAMEYRSRDGFIRDEINENFAPFIFDGGSEILNVIDSQGIGK